MKIINADDFDALLVDAQRRAKNNFQYGFLSSVRENLAMMPEAEAYTEAKKRIENMEKIIEDQQERIDIMSEGGWHKITESKGCLPKETYPVDVWVYCEYENGNPIVFRAIYSRRNFYDVSGRLMKEFKITHWMYNKEPEPPKGDDPNAHPSD